MNTLLQYIRGSSLSAKEIEEIITMILARHDGKEKIDYDYLMEKMKTTNKKHHHPQALSEDKDREEWHNLCHKLADLYDKMEGNEEGLTSLIIFKRTPLDYIALKGNNMRVDFGVKKD